MNNTILERMTRIITLFNVITMTWVQDEQEKGRNPIKRILRRAGPLCFQSFIYRGNAARRGYIIIVYIISCTAKLATI